MNYVVNYGVNWSHRRYENKAFHHYRNAVKFYKSLDKSIWKAGEIVKLVGNGLFEPADVLIKLEWDNGKELSKKTRGS
tara:strand:- start:33086 stop:33319 length:234 start_codon:yes stop_codon:yes gene_type:complete